MIQKEQLLYNEQLRFGTRSDIGICTQWQNPEDWKIFNKDSFGIIGPLYSAAGVVPMMRNVLQKPELRTIVLCGGRSFNGSGDALAALLKQGIDETGNIVGFDLFGQRVPIERYIPREAVELFREQISLIDWRELKLAEIATKVGEIGNPGSFEKGPTYFPETRLDLPVLESEKVGQVFYSKTIHDLWLRVVEQVLKFGTKKRVGGINTKEYLNIQAVLMSDTKVDYEKIPGWTGVNPDFMRKYEKEILTPGISEGKKYTYGSRMLNWGVEGIDQIELAIENLKKDPASRRVVVNLYDNRIDSKSTNPPCLTEIDFLSQDGKLFMTCKFRSHDIGSAWLSNTYALRKLQGTVAEKTGLEMGHMTIASHSAHIYERDFQSSADIVGRQKERLDNQMLMDPRGNIVIEISPDVGIVARHIDAKLGFPTGYEFVGRDPGKIAYEIALSGLVLGQTHMTYITNELWKAYLAVEKGGTYRQDH